jgi:hypothetical protein
MEMRGSREEMEPGLVTGSVHFTVVFAADGDIAGARIPVRTPRKSK